ncbi:MAG: NHL repeat-containing protein [Hyphomicrobiales bacterium]|nr:NHL repeat-containing protein [Hyphomicrobiales bacterium]
MIRLATFLLGLLVSLSASAGSFKAEFVNASDAVLSNPHDIDLSADGKYLYVSDLGHDRVAVLDAKKLTLEAAIGDKDGLAAPHDVHIGPDGRLYVADTGEDRVVIYEIDGLTGRKVDELTGPFGAPEGVLAHTDGRIYVTGAGSGNIVAFENGKPVARADGLRSPHDVAAAADGTLWVADAGNDRMLLMSRDLKILKTLTGKPYNFRGPRYQDITDDGNLVVADKYTHSIKVIAPEGALLAILGTGKRGKGPGVFATPEGVVVKGNDIWFADSGNNRVVRYRIVP